MSHHYSGPDYGFPHGDARLDLTDLYVFSTPGHGGRSVVIMNVHPSESVDPPGRTTDEPFSSEAVYELRIDTNADSVADVSYFLTFSSNVDGRQTATLKRVEGKAAEVADGSGKILIEKAPVSMGVEPQITEKDEYRLFAGWRSDPFFFDTLGALNGLRFTGSDFFSEKDVCSIVLEMPNSDLGGKRVGMWHRTVDGRSGKWLQADRGALPSQSVFLTGDRKAEYLAAEPVDDARFVPVFAHSLEHTGNYKPDEARRVAESLLPDVLMYDPALPVMYPTNGRALTDDVMDHFIALLSAGEITQDGVGPHKDLLSEFPYLGPPHRSRSPERGAIDASQKGE